MDTLLKALPALLEAFGPAGAVALLALGIFVYFYRRDVLRKVQGLREAHERRDKREERMIQALEANATNSEKVAGAINLLGEIVRRSER